MGYLSPNKARARNRWKGPTKGGAGRWGARFRAVFVVSTCLIAAPWSGIVVEAATATSMGGRGNAAEARRSHPVSAVTRQADSRAAPRRSTQRVERRAVRTAAPETRSGRRGGIVAPPAMAAPASPPTVSPEVLQALRAAAAASPSERSLLLALASRESRFVASARNPASSARGLMQFTGATWLEAVRDHGEAHGLAHYVATLSTDHDTGEISARDGRLLQELLTLRDDPHLSVSLAMARLGDEKASLARVLKRPVTDADLYLVHFLGPVGARRFLRELARAPAQRASSVVGAEAVAANRNVFVGRDGRHRTLRQVHDEARHSLRRQGARYAWLLEGAGADQRRTELAEAR